MGPPEGRWARLRARLRRPVRRQAGVALLLVTVTVAVMGATVGDFAYNARVDLEAASNSRDMLRAEYLARSSLQLGQLLVAVQAGLYKTLPPDFRDLFVITDYAGFLAKAFGGDDEARQGLGGLVGLDLTGVTGIGTPKGSSFDLEIASEEGKYLLNCGGGGVNPNAPDVKLKRQLEYLLISNLIRPLRYDRMFNVADRDGVIITREDLPRAIIDWTDLDLQRFEPEGNASASEERYDRGKDRYEAHNYNMDTLEELNLVRGVSEDLWAAFGEMFTVYGTQDCKVLAAAMDAKAWPLVAAMIAASSSDRNAVYDPNTAVVAQQVAGILKTGLPALKQLTKAVKIEPCKVDPKQCLQLTQPAGSSPAAGRPPAKPAAAAASGGDAVELLSNLICNPMITQLPTIGQGLSSMLGSTAPPLPQSPLRPIPMCPGALAQYLRDKPAAGSNPRRFYRLDATGIVQRNSNKLTQVRIRGVWDSQGINSTPLCTNHPSCFKGGTWVYWRMD